jgi:hypothetical protein
MAGLVVLAVLAFTAGCTPRLPDAKPGMKTEGQIPTLQGATQFCSDHPESRWC